MNIVNGEPLKEDKYRNVAVEEDLLQKQELKKPEPKKAQPPLPGAALRRRASGMEKQQN